MIISVDTQKMENPNEFGETLRKYCFKEEYGCYTCFDLIDEFKPIPLPEEIEKLMWEDTKNECYTNGSIIIAWGWDGDGLLVIKENKKIAVNTDCKHSDEWMWANETSDGENK